jgi:hypothetical protein
MTGGGDLDLRGRLRVRFLGMTGVPLILKQRDRIIPARTVPYRNFRIWSFDFEFITSLPRA